MGLAALLLCQPVLGQNTFYVSSKGKRSIVRITTFEPMQHEKQLI